MSFPTDSRKLTKVLKCIMNNYGPYIFEIRYTWNFLLSQLFCQLNNNISKCYLEDQFIVFL